MGVAALAPGELAQCIPCLNAFHVHMRVRGYTIWLAFHLLHRITVAIPLKFIPTKHPST